jgi:hypothetical protein
MRGALHCSLILVLLSCGATHREAAPTAAVAFVEPAPGLDTAQAYTRAIADYIALVARDSDAISIPDTLYIGRHADFPNIELPERIGHTTVRLVTPEAAEALRGGEHFAYLNIFGWFTSGEAEFKVVRFRHGMRHDPAGRDDRQLFYVIDPANGSLTLDSLRK